MRRELKELLHPLRRDLERVERWMRRGVHSGHDLPSSMNQHLLAMQGKQVRAALLIWCAGKQGQRTPPGVYRAAASLELLHSATLVHDDILDGAPLRRGLPAFHRRWPTGQVILYGDYLLACAFRLASSLEKLRVNETVSKVVADLCTGEIIQNQRAFQPGRTRRDYNQVIRLKTASLFAEAAFLGAHLGGFRPLDQRRVRAFGLSLGMAFQILDDCLDMTVSSRQSGKHRFRDLAEGKVTLPVILMLEKSSTADRCLLKKHLFQCTPQNRSLILRHLHQTGALAASLGAAGRHLARARRQLAGVSGLKYEKSLIALSRILEQPVY